MTWSEEFKKWCSAWQVDERALMGAHLNCLALPHISSVQAAVAVAQSASIVCGKTTESPTFALVIATCRTIRYASFYWLTAWILTERGRREETKHFCASFVRLTTINKSFVVLVWATPTSRLIILIFILVWCMRCSLSWDSKRPCVKGIQAETHRWSPKGTNDHRRSRLHWSSIDCMFDFKNIWSAIGWLKSKSFEAIPNPLFTIN